MIAPDRREYTTYPIPSFSNWSVQSVRHALDAHEQGYFEGSSLLFDQLQRNPRIASALTTRVLAVTGLPFNLESGDGDGRRNTPAVNRLKPHWPSIAPMPVVADLLRWAVGLGVGLGELVWRTTDDGDWVPRLKIWHPVFLHWREAEQRYYLNTRQGLIPITPGDGHWVLFSHTEHRPWMRGVVRCLGLEDTIRQDAVRDWARYSEVHGLPIRVAKVLANASDTDKKRFAAGLQNLGSETTVVAAVDREGKGFGLELVEASDQAHEGFAHLIERCDDDVEIAILGQTYSSGQKKGVYVAKTNATGVRQDLLEADAAAYGVTGREQICKPWARYNLGEASIASAPIPKLDPQPPADLAAEAATVKALGDGLAAIDAAGAKSGLQVDFEAYVERFSIPLKKAPQHDPENPGFDAEGKPIPGYVPPAPAAQPDAKPGAAKPPAPKGAEASLDAAGRVLAEGQVYIDAVTDRALSKAPAAVDPILAKVVAAVEASADYEDLRTRLAAVLSEVDPRKAQRLVRGAVLMAEAAGVWTVHQE